jgi:uncharacterized membrane protein
MKIAQLIILKLGLSILLLICLLDMPYGYYQIIRFIAMTIFILLSYNQYTKNKGFSLIIYICLAILFQPFIKISLGREIWNIVDILVSIYLIFNSIKLIKERKSAANKS